MDPASRVLDHLDALASPMLDVLTGMMRIPSVSGTAAENEAQAHMAQVFAAGGLDVDHWAIDLPSLTSHADFPGMEVDRSEAWGLVGRLPGAASGSGDEPTLMLNGHIDVVPVGDPEAWTDHPFSGSVVGDRLYGRGSCDMKAGLLASFWAAQAIRAAGVRLRGDLLIASVQGEEDGGLGTFATLERGWRADACVIPEPTDLDLVPGNAGALTFRLKVRGKATHASRRGEGVSALDKLWPVWAALHALEARRHTDIDPMARWPLSHPISLGTIHAGDWASSVPDLLTAEGRMGVAIDEPVEEAKQALEDAVAEACAADPWLRDHPVEVEWWGGQFASGRLPADSDLVGRVAAAHRTAGAAGNQSTWVAPYGSDLRLLTNHGRIPTIQYGPGDVTLAHGPDESVVIADIALCARALALVALDICGTA